jgi:hypothetical protein
MFQVRATAIGFAGDEEKYPCHFQHKVGDTFVYDGEKYIGRICPGFSAALVPRMMEFFAAGPRLVPSPQYYYAFWYAPVSRRDKTNKNMTASAFAMFCIPKLNRRAPSCFNRLTLLIGRRSASGSSLDNPFTCGDTRTLMMKIEAFDLAERRFHNIFPARCRF